MIKLSQRLSAIAEEVNTGTMADIGTDHGFLPIFLWQNGQCEKIIMTDISSGSLNKAKANCKRLCPDCIFDFRLGNGLDVIDSNEVDTVVIAGMGSPLIANLMSQNIEKCQNATFILQPRRHEEYLREWLDLNKFEIIKDRFVKERNLICQILVVRFNPYYIPKKYDYMFPDSILQSELANEYLAYWLKKCERNLKSAKQGSNPQDINKWMQAIERILYLRGKLNDI